ncbi:MAG: hypothetical protein A2Y33_13040 [Spirochaetes bacterium GWF1_51_8]|nr:MAG: hypothetical protein A2Y33_13040 [Spirochaetes bacterium GWF1_51_8]
MGAEKEHGQVKLVLGVIFTDSEIYEKMLARMTEYYGGIDYRSEVIPFIYTHYYDGEMGGNILRQFVTFGKPIDPVMLVDIKKFTNTLENEHARDGNRPVNFDPGYLELGKFILATTKDQQHRIYIREGIYEEITLYFRGKDWEPYEWTYPDYRSREYRDIFLEIRKRFKKDRG